jgi:biopolymer transport protein ExbD
MSAKQQTAGGRRRAGLRGLVPTDVEINMTPMIDIVFQLLIFFVLTAKFIEFEGELLSYLPKDRGLSAAPAENLVPPVTVFLRWEGDPLNGRCLAVTTNFQPADGGLEQRHTFSTIPGGHGKQEGWPANHRVGYDYPDFREIRDYMAYRKQRAEVAGGKKLPVTINSEDLVPWQMVVNMLDICQELGIEDFAINAEPIE